jgi:hypothetical protein
MQLLINIKKKHFYILVIIFSILNILLIVNGAYVGHNWDNIAAGNPILTSLKITGNADFDGVINASNGIKIGADAGEEGLLRWNDTLKLLEIHNNTTWMNVSQDLGGNSTISSTDCYWSGWFCGALICNPGYLVVGFNGNSGANEACYGSGDFDLETKQIYCCKLI